MIDRSLKLKEYETLRNEVLDSLGTSFNVWRLGLWGIAALAAVVFLQWGNLRKDLSKDTFPLCSYEIPFVLLVALLLFIIGLSLAVIAARVNRSMEKSRDRVGGYLVVFHESSYASKNSLPVGWHYWNRFEKWSERAVPQSLRPEDWKVSTRRAIEAPIFVWTYAWAIVLLGFVISVFYADAFSQGSSKVWVSPLLFWGFLLVLAVPVWIYLKKMSAEGELSLAFWSARWLQVADWARNRPDIIDQFERNFFKRSS